MTDSEKKKQDCLNSITEKAGPEVYKWIYGFCYNAPQEEKKPFMDKLSKHNRLKDYYEWVNQFESKSDADILAVSRRHRKDHDRQEEKKKVHDPAVINGPEGKGRKDHEQNIDNKGQESEAVTAKDSLSQFHIFNDKGVATGLLDDAIAEDVIKSQSMFNYQGMIYVYDSGVYLADPLKIAVKEMISDRMYQRFKKYQNILQVNNLILTKRSIIRTEAELNAYPVSGINFKNGILDVRTLKLYPHDPRYYSLNQIPYDWIDKEPDPDSVTVRYHNDLIPDDHDREMFFQYCGLCMTRDTSQQKFMIIHGNGGTGKSVLLRNLARAIGEPNICNIPLQDICNNRFSSAYLFGKTVCMYGDLPSKDMEAIDILKTITGEDSVRAEIKGGAIFSFHPYCKLIYSANKIPKSRDDKTDAYYRRMLILNINQRATEIKDLEKKLEADIQSFIWLSVQALHRMYESGRITESENSLSSIAQLYADTDAVQAFLVDNGYIITGKLQDRVNRVELYQEFCQYCEDEGRQQAICTRRNFYSTLCDKGCFSNDNIRFKGERAIAGLMKIVPEGPIPFT